jgi:hypothetical protein
MDSILNTPTRVLNLVCFSVKPLSWAFFRLASHLKRMETKFRIRGKKVEPMILRVAWVDKVLLRAPVVVLN